MPDAAAAPDGRATIREVYALVDDRTAAITSHIDERTGAIMDTVNSLAASVQSTFGAHEHRLTVVEEHQANHAGALSSLTTRVDAHSGQLSALETRTASEEAATAALQDAKDRRRDWRRFAVPLFVSSIVALGASLIVVLVH